jgi:hypothetical protein
MVKKQFKTQLSGQIGEHLVVAELGRLGIIATSFAGNVPDIDVLAYANGNSVPIQVKAQRAGAISVDAKKYLNLQFDGEVQIISGKSDSIDRALIFVLVKVGARSGEDEFYIFDQGTVQDLVFEGHSRFLKKHCGIRPRNPKSTHCSYYISDLLEYKNNWKLIMNPLEI